MRALRILDRDARTGGLVRRHRVGIAAPQAGCGGPRRNGRTSWPCKAKPPAAAKEPLPPPSTAIFILVLSESLAVGWVERSDKLFAPVEKRWWSLRSTHPTTASSAST